MHALVPIRNLSRRSALLAFLCVAFSAIAWVGGTRLVRRPGTIAKAGRVPTAITRTAPLPELEVEKIVQHGHIVEIKAKVEPGATVMVNGERAAVIWGEGEIRHFVGPLPDGMNEIAITVQNSDGGFKSQKVAVTLP